MRLLERRTWRIASVEVGLNHILNLWFWLLLDFSCYFIFNHRNLLLLLFLRLLPIIVVIIALRLWRIRLADVLNLERKLLIIFVFLSR